MKILIWTGYQNPHWNKSTWDNKGIGGSEYCILKLAKYFTKCGHNVMVSGDVIQGKFDNVQYIHYEKFLEWRGPVGHKNPNALKVFSHFDVVIGANYLNYAKHLEDNKITYDQSYFWMHNEDYYKWYKGGELKNTEDYLHTPKLNKIVGVSKFHEDLLKNNAKSLFDYTQEKAIDTISHMNNAIDVNDYTNSLNNKVKGRVIWSSSPDRGLDFILQNWDSWKEQRPDLSLVVCSPPYSKNWSKADMSKLKDVEWKGALNPVQLREEQSKAEYWVYASDYTETYCITALEMMLQKVKIITNGAGNIKNLIADGQRGILIDEIDSNVIIDHLKSGYDKNMIERAYNYAANQSWENRTIEWLNLIKDEAKKV